jgi:type VI secretion system Hcp family effector
MSKSCTVKAALLVTMLIVFPVGPSLAEEQIFVQLVGSAGDEILGESVGVNHDDWIDAYGLEEAHGDLCSGSCGGGLGEIRFLKGADRASVRLHEAIGSGETLASATIEVCAVDQFGALDCRYRIELEGVRISAISVAGSACTESVNCVPAQTESVSLSYELIRWIYEDAEAGRIEFAWDTQSGGPPA